MHSVERTPDAGGGCSRPPRRAFSKGPQPTLGHEPGLEFALTSLRASGKLDQGRDVPRFKICRVEMRFALKEVSKRRAIAAQAGAIELDGEIAASSCRSATVWIVTIQFSKEKPRRGGVWLVSDCWRTLQAASTNCGVDDRPSISRSAASRSSSALTRGSTI